METMNSKQNLYEVDNIEEFDFDVLEAQLEAKLEEDLSAYKFLEEEKEKIGNPDALTQVISNEIWKQFANQIGLDITNETLIQKYDREHPETYDEVKDRVMRDPKYKEANKEMKNKQQTGNLKDAYTGKKIKREDKANLDHVVSRKEIFENQRRKQANLSTEELANKKENLKPTNESLNKSKKDKSVDEYLEHREQREKDLKEQNKRANKKIDESNMSPVEKKAAKEKNNKRLQDKLDADDERMKEADKKARNAINKDIAIGVTKQVSKKASIDALKQMSIEALFALLKEIMNGLIRFFKSQAKSFNSFLEEMKKSIRNFFNKITSFLETGATSFVGTVVSEIFGPIVSLFKRLASLIKQGVSTIWEAIKYLRDEKHKNEPFSIKVAQVGKIIVAGMVAGGAIFGGEVFEKFLITVPGMQIQIPMIGTLANIIGMFLASVISGVVGAIALNLIDKFIAKKQKREILERISERNNNILIAQRQLYEVSEGKMFQTKNNTNNNINERHNYAYSQINNSLENIEKNLNNDKYGQESLDKIETETDSFLKIIKEW
ncbi:MAG: hypothetical protein DBY32_08130 [Phascolarctobacterium sp.]|nr:MAG: hypothetical protein DBY32_08130 [Phascolarctobacterium sp.]